MILLIMQQFFFYKIAIKIFIYSEYTPESIFIFKKVWCRQLHVSILFFVDKISIKVSPKLTVDNHSTNKCT